MPGRQGPAAERSPTRLEVRPYLVFQAMPASPASLSPPLAGRRRAAGTALSTVEASVDENQTHPGLNLRLGQVLLMVGAIESL